MSDIALKTEYSTGFTAVPDIFLERFMPHANGEFVKVYLFLLKSVCSRKELGVSDIADGLEKEETDVLRALKYWAKQGVLKLFYNNDSELTGISLCDISRDVTSGESAILENADRKEKAFKSSHTLPEAKKEATKQRMPEDVALLITACEGYFNRPLTLSDKNIILYLYDDLGMSFELIDYLLCRAVETDKKQLRYIEKVAISLHEDGITSVNEASARFKENSETVHVVMRSFGLNSRSPSPAEQKYITKWSDTFAFDNTLIEEACTRSVMNTNTGSFKYADKILTTWHKEGVKSISDVEALDARHKASTAAAPKKPGASKSTGFHNFEQRKENIEELERKLLS